MVVVTDFYSRIWSCNVKKQKPNLLALIKLTDKITPKKRRFVNNCGKIKRKDITLGKRIE
ncbi:MAG: hypothetical protein ACI85O_000579 [Saprospiraceae bacterium]